MYNEHISLEIKMCTVAILHKNEKVLIELIMRRNVSMNRKILMFLSFVLTASMLIIALPITAMAAVTSVSEPESASRLELAYQSTLTEEFGKEPLQDEYVEESLQEKYGEESLQAEYVEESLQDEFGEVSLQTESVLLEDQTAITFSVTNITSPPGSSVLVPIIVNNNPGVSMIRIDVTLGDSLSWNYNPVEYSSDSETWPFISCSDVLSLSQIRPVDENFNESFVSLLFPGSGENVMTNGTLVILKLKINGDIQDSCDIPINITVRTCVNQLDEDVEFIAYDGYVRATPFIWGDVNGDDKVDDLDLQRLTQYLNGWDVVIFPGADVNGDGIVDDLDQLRLMQRLNGWSVKLGPPNVETKILQSVYAEANNKIVIELSKGEFTYADTYEFTLIKGDTNDISRVRFNNAIIDNNKLIFTLDREIGADATFDSQDLYIRTIRNDIVGFEAGVNGQRKVEDRIAPSFGYIFYGMGYYDFDNTLRTAIYLVFDEEITASTPLSTIFDTLRIDGTLYHLSDFPTSGYTWDISIVQLSSKSDRPWAVCIDLAASTTSILSKDTYVTYDGGLEDLAGNPVDFFTDKVEVRFIP